MKSNLKKIISHRRLLAPHSCLYKPLLKVALTLGAVIPLWIMMKPRLTVPHRVRWAFALVTNSTLFFQLRYARALVLLMMMSIYPVSKQI